MYSVQIEILNPVCHLYIYNTFQIEIYIKFGYIYMYSVPNRNVIKFVIYM